MLGKTTKTPVDTPATTAWDHLVAKMRDELGKVAKSGDFYTTPDRKFLRSDAPRLAQTLGNGRIGAAQAALAGIGFLAAVIFVDQSSPSAMTGTVSVVAALVVGVAAVAVAALWLTHRVVVHPHEARVVEVGQLTLDAYEDAVKEIRHAVTRGQAGAAKAESALADITPGLQELIIEHQKVTAAENTQPRSSLVTGGYRTALTEHREALESEMLDIAAEVTAAARVLFSQRDDLLVAVQAPEAAHRVDLDALKVRTTAAQDRLAKGRQQLAELALDQG